jgi:hypothetical protein
MVLERRFKRLRVFVTEEVPTTDLFTKSQLFCVLLPYSFSIFADINLLAPQKVYMVGG